MDVLSTFLWFMFILSLVSFVQYLGGWCLWIHSLFYLFSFFSSSFGLGQQETLLEVIWLDKGLGQFFTILPAFVGEFFILSIWAIRWLWLHHHCPFESGFRDDCSVRCSSSVWSKLSLTSSLNPIQNSVGSLSIGMLPLNHPQSSFYWTFGLEQLTLCYYLIEIFIKQFVSK